MVTLSTSTLLDSPEIYKIEFNLISLFDRTFKKGINGQSGPKLKNSVKQWFSSNTFKIQLDKIIDDLYLYTVNSTDKLIKTTLKADFTERHMTHFLSAADEDTQGDENNLTDEAVITCLYLASEISDSIIEDIKKEVVTQETHVKLTTRIFDFWKKYKYRAETWIKTFSADVVNNVALSRYEQKGIEECVFSAVIDDRTSPQCRALNGLIMKVGSPEARRFLPPLHPRCRSRILPIIGKVNDNFRYENRDFTKPTEGAPFTKKDVKKIFDNIDNFNEKYKMSQTVFTKDIKMRLIKLGLMITG